MAIESKLARGPIGRPMPPSSEGKNRTGLWMALFVIVILIVAGAIWWFTGGRGIGAIQSTKSESYQAVFLDNGQVYFGRLTTQKDGFDTLTEVFYLQTGSVELDQQGNLQLTKLGNEAHGPKDEMKINREHILFIENMKDDSKVASAIKSYQSNKK
ncbi:hypothetical protein HZA85_00370 [Candidatus Uhrbacteria bacterium]|nr:hypothetical protein [Candidatus Uhrbacteria bacterium]